MSRTVKIAGRTITFDSGLTPPPIKAPNGPAKSPFRLALEAMRPGESAFFPFSYKGRSGIVTHVAKQSGYKMTTRTEGDGFRVYCLPQAAANGSTSKAETREMESAW